MCSELVRRELPTLTPSRDSGQALALSQTWERGLTIRAALSLPLESEQLRMRRSANMPPTEKENKEKGAEGCAYLFQPLIALLVPVGEVSRYTGFTWMRNYRLGT